MTDRELLEAAASAAGVGIRWAADLNGYIYDVDWGYSPREMWSPLTDDGDRYRLARKLKLTVSFETRCVLTPDGQSFIWGDEESEPYAFVHAAAAMGEGQR